MDWALRACHVSCPEGSDVTAAVRLHRQAVRLQVYTCSQERHFRCAARAVCCASRALRSCGRVLRSEGVRGVRLVSSGSCSSTPLLRWELCAPVRRVLRVLCAKLVYLVESDDYRVQRLVFSACCVLRWHTVSAGGLGVCEGAGARSPAAAGSGSTTLRLPSELCAPSKLCAPFYCGRGVCTTASLPLRTTSTTGVSTSD